MSLLPATDTPHEAPFWQGLRDGELRMQHCLHCGNWQFPPLLGCGVCGRAVSWVPVSGRGTIWSVTEIHAPVLPAFASLVPYLVVLVELEESSSLRMVGSLLPVEGGAIYTLRLADVAIGMKVKAEIEALAEDAYWPRWRLREQALARAQ
jgi:uncharacterized OB-fold protein